jgi:hypothetical protein
MFINDGRRMAEILIYKRFSWHPCFTRISSVGRIVILCYFAFLYQLLYLAFWNSNRSLETRRISSLFVFTKGWSTHEYLGVFGCMLSNISLKRISLFNLYWWQVIFILFYNLNTVSHDTVFKGKYIVWPKLILLFNFFIIGHF